MVVDSLTGIPLQNAAVEIIELADTLDTGLTGSFKIGMLEGGYSMTAKANGYKVKSLSTTIFQGDSIYLVIPLVPEGFSDASHHPTLPALSVYPNPSKIGFTIDLSGHPDASFIQVFDEKGAFLREEKTDGVKLFTLNFGENKAGTYLTTILNKEGALIATARLSTF